VHAIALNGRSTPENEAADGDVSPRAHWTEPRAAISQADAGRRTGRLRSSRGPFFHRYVNDHRIEFSGNPDQMGEIN
jgi:hypothetical protein